MRERIYAKIGTCEDCGEEETYVCDYKVGRNLCEDCYNLEFQEISNGGRATKNDEMGLSPSPIGCYIGANHSLPPPNYNKLILKGGNKMVESQSRFSIIEALTNSKLETLNRIDQIKDEIEKTKTNFDRYKEDTERDIKRREQDKDQRVKVLTANIASETQKLTEIERGIVAIEKLSEEKDKGKEKK